jgi:polyketide cyclase/dehydrase/lipid transport protein
MASITRKIHLRVAAEVAWAAVRDVGAVDLKLVPGLVSRVGLKSGLRHVVFANGLEIDELIVTIDEAARRLVYAVQNRAQHHQASMQVLSGDEAGCDFVWTTDVLPDDAASRFAVVMDEALPIIKRTIESNAPQL